MIALLPTTDAHQLELAGNLSADAHREILALRMQPLEAIRMSVEKSTIATTMLLEEKVGAIFGVTPAPLPLPSNAGRVWVLPSPAIDLHPVLFARESRRIIGAFLKYHSLLVARLDANNEKTIRWAKHLGFQVGERTPYSKENPHPMVGVWLHTRNFRPLRVVA